MSEKPNCYKCKHRRELAGDAHSRCVHPAFEAANKDPLLGMLGIFASVGRVSPIQVKTDGIEVVGNPHGIKMGWFCHPVNFDPTWLEKCTGFEEKEDA